MDSYRARSVAPSSLHLVLLLPLLPLRLAIAARLRGRNTLTTQKRLRRGNLRATSLLLLGLELANQSASLLPRKRSEENARARAVVAVLPAGERTPRGRHRPLVVRLVPDAELVAVRVVPEQELLVRRRRVHAAPRGRAPEACAARVSWNSRDDASASRARMSASGSSVFARNASFGLCARMGHSRSPLACPKPPQRRHCVARICTPRGRAPTPSASPPPPRGATRGAPASSGNASAAATFLPSASRRILRFLRRAISSAESGGRPAATRAAVSSAPRAAHRRRARRLPLFRLFPSQAPRRTREASGT